MTVNNALIKMQKE